MEEQGQRVIRRMTKQRRVILDTLRATNNHPTADGVYHAVRKKIPDISLGTIYRNLRLLTEQGEIQELNWGSTYSRFDGYPEDHYHFNCEQCGQVRDVHMPLQVQLEKQVESGQDWEVRGHRLEFFGLCPRCRQNQKAGGEG